MMTRRRVAEVGVDRQGSGATACEGELDLDAVEHMAVLSPGGGAVTRALIRHIRALQVKMRSTGESLVNFVGEDEQEGRELAAMSQDLLRLASAGVTS